MNSKLDEHLRDHQLTQHHEYQESIVSAANRLKSDVEHCYNLLMEVRMSKVVSRQLELLREVEGLTNKAHSYCVETIRQYQQ